MYQCLHGSSGQESNPSKSFLMLTGTQDALFENMTYDQWKLTVQSKANTSWNLHKLLPNSLDFFVQLSSLSGIYGSIAQSNYSAACTFQDALARYRVARGQRAVSLDLGWMLEAGIISANEEYQRQREHLADMRKVDNQEFLSLLDIYCDPDVPSPQASESQLLVGVVTPSEQIARGLPSPGPAQMRPLFSGFFGMPINTSSTETRGIGAKKDPANQFKRAAEHDARALIVIEALRDKLARALTIHDDAIDVKQPVADYGVDSLIAAELRNWFRSVFDAEIAVFEIMRAGATMATLGGLVAEKSKLCE
jgi:aryl carrier-like protein